MNSEPSSAFALTKVEVRVGIIAFLLALVARFPAVIPGYSIDDYQFVNRGLPSWFDELAVMNGRALGYVLYAGLARLGAAPPRAGVLYVLLLTVALVATGIVACRMWGLSGNFGPALIVTSLIALHPYQAEIFTFRTATMVAAIPMLLAMIAIVACTGSRAHWLVSLLLLTCAISIYQVVLSYLALLLLFTFAFQYFESREAFRSGLRSAVPKVALIATSVVLYLTLTFLISRFSGVALGSRTSPVGDVAGRLMQIAAAFRRLGLSNEPVLPFNTKLLLMMTFATGLVGCVAGTFKGRGRRLLTLAIAAVFGAPLSLGLAIVLRDFPLSPRVISQTSVYVAGMMTLVFMAANANIRRVMVGGIALVLLSFTGINEQILTDQLRVNLRDMAEANRILMRVEMLPQFPQVRTVVLNGGSPLYAARIRTVQDDINISALFADWSKVGLLNETSGYSFDEPSAAEKAQAAEVCKTRPKWPSAEAVSAMGTAAVVCLPSD